MRALSGFTLLELLIGVALAALLLALATPAFNRLVVHNQRVAAINHFVGSLQLARSEALTRGREVVLCPSSDGEKCATGAANWRFGWLMFVDRRPARPRQPEPGDELLRVSQARQGTGIFANREAFVLRPFLRRSTNGTVRFCPASEDVPPRAVIVSFTGRPRQSPTLPNGASIPCPASP